MKKLLSLLGSIATVATGSASVVSCDLLGGGSSESGAEADFKTFFKDGIDFTIPEDQDGSAEDAIVYVKGLVKPNLVLFDSTNDFDMKTPVNLDDESVMKYETIDNNGKFDVKVTSILSLNDKD
ncbi:hypothetical protein Zmor_009042 [Zophobas morio]|uniref:Lipoprotein n=1 Tax=Zophobas morio TaxID=2755281 RepID=A0AA38HIZ6_9CUCU|nr:hypothetical protein Zmor_009042 [Zophobas morio]